jgi:hypothetical protein
MFSPELSRSGATRHLFGHLASVTFARRHTPSNPMPDLRGAQSRLHLAANLSLRTKSPSLSGSFLDYVIPVAFGSKTFVTGMEIFGC